jgi:uncharacterized delta-60 repeat protein
MFCLARYSNLSNTLSRRLSISFLALLLLMLCGRSSQAAPGDLDPTFGTGGKVITPIGSSAYNAVRAVAIQPDGKIVTAGNVVRATYDFGLVRYNTDGSLDTTFGTGGKVVTPIGNSTDIAYAVAIQSNGKIVAAGTTVGSGTYDFGLVRYNTDGSLDTTFGTGSKIVTPIGSREDQAFAIAIQPDGKIVAVGYTNSYTGSSANDDFALVRYNTDGSLDTTFGTGGKVVTPIGSIGDVAYAVAIQSNGKIVAAGYSQSDIYNTPENFALVRYNVDGTLDTTFGTGGKVVTPIGDSYSVARGVAIQPDGKIIAAGYTSGYTQDRYDDFALARYNVDGTLDTTFGTGGIVITPAVTDDIAFAVAIQPDGKIIAAGYSAAQNYDFTSVRYNTNGTLDTTFGTGGIVATSIGPGNDEDVAYGVAIQPDGKIIAAGYTYTGSSYDCALARYLGTATTTVANAGDVIISEFRFSGPNGNATDEFIELYNNTSNDIMVSDPNGGAGWLLSCSNGTGSTLQKSRQLSQNTKPSRRNVVASSDLLIPNGTVLPAHRHFLIANTGFSLQSSGGINHAFPDLTLSFDMPDNGGIALYASSVSTGTRLDAVGFSTAGSAQLYEGSPLTPIAAAGANEQYSFIRKISNDVVQDTNDNAADFILISSTATVGGAAAALGAPGPENLFAPVYKSPAQIAGQYLDPTAPSIAQPNRVIESGVLKIRRTYTNNTGVDVRRLRFRVFDLTTLNNTQGVPAPVADLRVISSQNETLNTAFGSKTALALTREEPPDQTTTLLDGGLHTTLSADTVTLVNPLRAGQSINIAYWLRVVAGGRFRFFVNIEALP